MFIINAIIPLIYSVSILNFFGSGGLLGTINGIFITNIWMTPIVNILGDVSWYLKIWKRNKVLKFIETGEGGPYSQKEANDIFKNNEWWVSFKYAQLIKNFAVGLFYFPLIPYSMFYTFLILIIQFNVEKVTYR